MSNEVGSPSGRYSMPGIGKIQEEDARLLAGVSMAVAARSVVSSGGKCLLPQAGVSQGFPRCAWCIIHGLVAVQEGAL